MKKLMSKLTLLLTGFVALTGCDNYTKLTREEAREKVIKFADKMCGVDGVTPPDQFSVDYSFNYKFELKDDNKWENFNDFTVKANMYYDSINGLGYICGNDVLVEGTKKSADTYEAWLYKDGAALTLAYRKNLSIRNYYESSSISEQAAVYERFLSLAHDFQYYDVVKSFFEAILSFTDDTICNFLENDEGRSSSIVYKTKNEKHLKINAKTSAKHHDLTTSYNEVFEIDNYFPVYNKSILKDDGYYYDSEQDKSVCYRRNINKLWDLNVVQPKDNGKRPDLKGFNQVEELGDLEGGNK